MTVREAAERLAVSTFTVYGMCERGELPHVRISNAIRIAPADLAAFLAGQRSGGALNPSGRGPNGAGNGPGGPQDARSWVPRA